MISHDIFWQRTPPSPASPLTGDTTTDVVIIGGGMTGLMAARALTARGRSVIVLEQSFCGAGASGASSGFITPDSEIELHSLIESYGPKTARHIWDFVLSGVHAIRETITRHTLACEYHAQDALFLATRRSAARYPRAEHAAREQLGYQSRLYTAETLPTIIGSAKAITGVRYPDTYSINSYQYCQELKRILRDEGVPIFEATPATSLEPHSVTTPHGSVRAHHTIVATDRFLPELGVFPREVYHIQTFLGISAPLDQATITSLFPEKPLMVWDTDLIYQYFRLTGDNRLLVGGGDIRHTYARNPAHNLARMERRLQSYLTRMFPNLTLPLTHLWPGMLGVSKDLLPVMGSDPTRPNTWYVGAATGLPWAAALGVYAAERILDGRTDADDLFSPKRHVVIGKKMQRLLGTPLTFALSHGITKYIT